MAIPNHPLRIHYFKHVPFEGLGHLESWALGNGHSLSGTHFWETSDLPDLTALDWLIVMGGPMGVYEADQHTWLAEEIQFIRRAIDAGKTVIGICLGAQLIAAALGAKVYPSGVREIGWFPIEKTESGRSHPLLASLPDSFTVFHWHGDTFELPEGAIHLFRSVACQQQAFLFGDRVLGLQFHLEVTPGDLVAMIDHGRDELQEAEHVQSDTVIMQLADENASAKLFLADMLDRLAELNQR